MRLPFVSHCGTPLCAGVAVAVCCAVGFLGLSRTAWAAGAKKAVAVPRESAKLVDNVHGTFDMSKQPRPYAALLILDQAGNRYPSFWCGRNLEGKIKFDGRHDLLEDRAVVEHSGGFTVQLSNTARKFGMYDALPGGVWAEKVREVDFRISFERFDDVTLTGTRRDGGDRSSGGNLVQFDATFTGKMSVNGHSAPIAGTAVLEFSDLKPAMKLVAKFAVPGKELGLEGAKGEGIAATLYTSSASGASAVAVPTAVPDL